MLRLGPVALNGVALSIGLFLLALLLGGLGMEPAAMRAVEMGTALSGFGFSAIGLVWGMRASFTEQG